MLSLFNTFTACFNACTMFALLFCRNRPQSLSNKSIKPRYVRTEVPAPR